MRIKAKIDSRDISIGIRNSGTQEKISISIRMDSYHMTDIYRFLNRRSFKVIRTQNVMMIP